MNQIKLYNSLTRKKETFKPIGSEVKIYSCGPTVYSEQHIGNLRTMLLNDILIRILKYNNIEKAAKKENLSASQITKKYIDLFEADLKKLNIQFGKRVRATSHIKEQIELIKRLERRGFTYKTPDGIYFNTKKFKSYGKLSNFAQKEKQAGKRISLKDKKNPTDFALWKFSQPNESRLQEWNSPWGEGFPGWHIECSAMSMHYLGKTIDIHTGGQDLSQVHHNNEIAQSEAATGKQFVNFWIHGGFLLIQGEKAAKSTGNIYTLTELEQEGYAPEHFRYLTLQTHYRKPLNFSLENLDAASSAFSHLKRKIIEIKKENLKSSDKTKEYESKFINAINDDLNMPRALQILWEIIEDYNFSSKSKIALIEKFDKVLGLNLRDIKESKTIIPKEISELVKKREVLRREKQWAQADIIRQRIKELGFKIQDTEKGPILEEMVKAKDI